MTSPDDTPTLKIIYVRCACEGREPRCVICKGLGEILVPIKRAA